MEMIERVARAIEITIVENTMHHSVSKLLPRMKWLWPIVARAVITAMREPTDVMVSDGESAASFGIGKPSDDEALPRVWHEMIDAALSPSQ